MTIPFAELRNKWKKDPEFQKEYEALKPEFKLAREFIEAHSKAVSMKVEINRVVVDQRNIAGRAGRRLSAMSRRFLVFPN